VVVVVVVSTKMVLAIVAWSFRLFFPFFPLDCPLLDVALASPFIDSNGRARVTFVVKW
jgi:hypothetical protein